MGFVGQATRRSEDKVLILKLLDFLMGMPTGGCVIWTLRNFIGPLQHSVFIRTGANSKEKRTTLMSL